MDQLWSDYINVNFISSILNISYAVTSSSKISTKPGIRIFNLSSGTGKPCYITGTSTGTGKPGHSSGNILSKSGKCTSNRSIQTGKLCYCTSTRCQTLSVKYHCIGNNLYLKFVGMSIFGPKFYLKFIGMLIFVNNLGKTGTIIKAKHIGILIFGKNSGNNKSSTINVYHTIHLNAESKRDRKKCVSIKSPLSGINLGFKCHVKTLLKNDHTTILKYSRTGVCCTEMD